ncbi:hypothetical protein FQR65_LT00813 [Abscondita terminalis]|nr:hypothetical protein FQR65_LT00813 [Abscondita terminalis]
MIGIISSLTRLSLRTLPYKINLEPSSVLIHTTPCLLGEPLKKKKRLDPAIVKAREDRKKRKLEKQIRKLERNARQLKPIEECEIPLAILDSQKQRVRKTVQLSKEVIEQRAALEKQWAKYKHDLHLADVQLIDRIVFLSKKH